MRKNHRLLAAAGSMLAAGAIALSGIVAAAAAPHAARSHGKCSDTKPPVAFELLIRASGPVHL